MRQKGSLLSVPQVWNGSEWSDYPSGRHAITGQGEDPWSQGEWADEISEQEAQKIAAERGIDLYASESAQRSATIEADGATNPVSPRPQRFAWKEGDLIKIEDEQAQREDA